MYILHLALKTGPDRENSRKYFPFGEKIVKIGPVDTNRDNFARLVSTGDNFAHSKKIKRN